MEDICKIPNKIKLESFSENKILTQFKVASMKYFPMVKMKGNHLLSMSDVPLTTEAKCLVINSPARETFILLN